MQTNAKQSISKQLCFVLLLLATTVSSQMKCVSFQEVADFDTESNVLSAPGFVQDLTIPSDEAGIVDFATQRYENATAIVVQYGKTVSKPRFLDLNKQITIRLPGTGESFPGYDSIDVDFDGFMSYFENGGVGLVIELEEEGGGEDCGPLGPPLLLGSPARRECRPTCNHSTLGIDFIDGDGNIKSFTAEPAKLFTDGSKVALAVMKEVEMTITIPSANVLSISMDRKFTEDNAWWYAAEDIAGSGQMNAQELGKTVFTGKMGPNQCLDVTTTLAPTSSPTPDPTSGAVARRSGFPTAAFTALVAAVLVARW